MKRSLLTLHFLLFAVAIITFNGCRSQPAEEKLNITFEKYTMPNGLQVILHEDHSDPVISYAIMYHTGSSREKPGKTGFAHLFEHLLFMGSENVPVGAFDMILENMGGSNNGGTSKDYTVYYEIFPKNALEKVLWLESDRMGFFINSVTPKALAIQQNVVQNEKRQGVDNAPYGFTDYVIYRNLYPAGHPYSWDVIGEMEDLQNASVEDVKEYYSDFYGPNNATLVLAGDFHSDSVKLLVEKYFDEIKSHGNPQPRQPMVPVLENTVKLFHEDNFARVPELTIVWPVAEAYSKDSYALDFLARILSEGKKAPLYKVLVKEKNLTSAASAYNHSQELSGDFYITVRANEGKTLKEVEEAISEAFTRFETEGITEKDVERVKASIERNFYNDISSVFGKSIQLASYNVFMNDPGFIEKDIENIKAVTLGDVKGVYEKYIKGKHHIVTSFVPKGKPELMAENSVPAGVKQENISEASQVEIGNVADEEIIKTPSSIDRTKEPSAGRDPEIKVPVIWKAELANGIKLYGIENRELPLVDMRITIAGGVLQDSPALPGVANMTADVLPQGTRNKTPEELEEEIKLLGSTITINASAEEINVSAGSLSRNFEKTVQLVKEILLEPRWDSTEFVISQTRNRNRIIQAEAQPGSIASTMLYRLMYGKENIFGYSSTGTRKSIDRITINDLKTYYENNFSPSGTKIHIAGNITREEALEAFTALGSEWKAKPVRINDYPVQDGPVRSEVYFYDMPGSFQSVVSFGYLAIPRDHPDFPKCEFINYRLGGAFTSIFNQILREEKGFTYGARSSFREMKTRAPFSASTSVRTDATLETLQIFRTEMEKYRQGIAEDEVQFIQNSMIRSNALQFETNGSLTSMLATMSKYNFPDDYMKREEDVVRNMTVEEHRATAQKYIIPERMYYVVVGDAATQLKEVAKAGLGKPVLVSRENLAD
jgi:zinc protease